MYKKIELVQKIGEEVCEGCEYSDCGIEPPDCSRIINAIKLLDEYQQTAPKPGQAD